MTKSLLETDIFNYKTPEFFINMKNIPDKTSVERKDFVLEEKRKGIEGININGIYIPGSLYFHLNYYHLEGDDPITKKKTVMLPRLRDNEWVIFNDYEKCSVDKLVYLLFGARQIAKSEIETSLCLRELSLFRQTEALALFSGKPDKDTFVKKISTAITHGEKFIIIPNIDNDWSKEEIRFGITKVDNTTDLRGRLYIYNTQEGKKIQVGSGKSVSFLLMDEIAKSPYRSVYDTIEPALLSDFGGLRCAPILAFTGGETDKAQDAKNAVENPNKETQFVTTLEDGKEIGGRFMSGLYRKDCKEEKTLSQYLNKKTGTWIDSYPIQVSNFEKAKQKIEKEKEDALKSPDKSTYTLKRIFFPLNLDDVFLSESHNNFPVEACKAQQKWLETNYTPEYVDLFRNQKNKVDFRYSDNKPIVKFPVNAKDLLKYGKIPCSIYEHPDLEAPFATYCIGIDPYNENESSDKINSLGSIHVFKRYYKVGDAFANKFVFSWTGRCKTVGEFHELCLMVMEYYNAIEGALPENEDKTMIQYVIMKKKGHYFAKSLDLSKQINQKTKSNRLIGLSAATPNQNHYMSLLIEYTKEETNTIDEIGNIEEYLGASKILDPMLLEEFIQYKGKPSSSKGIHDGNYDRVISSGHALTLAKYYDALYPLEGYKPKSTEPTKPEVRVQTFFGDIVPKSKSPFRSENQRTPRTNINW
jgi:hypothetical protein